jgi:hypothetical protein
MSMRILSTLAGLAAGVFMSAAPLCAAEPRSTPLPVPLTRPEMKQALEDLKGRAPRIPLPELTEEDKAKLGDRSGYESRLRYHYSPSGDERGGGGFFSREPDPNMSLSYEFKTQLFWIVSRTNNCHY